jgi:hypothetical protein
MLLVTQGPTAQAWIATGAYGAALLTGNTGNVAMKGNPALRVQVAGSGVGATGVRLDNLNLSQAGGSAPDADAREWYRIEAYPEARAIQANSSVFRYDRISSLRGQPPRPVVNASTGSGPAKMVVLTGDAENYFGNDVVDVRVDTLERFSFLR